MFKRCFADSRLIQGSMIMLLGLAMVCSPIVQTFAQDSPPAAGEEEQEATENPFPGKFPAPSLDGGVEWMNCAGPISIQDLRGKIVILDFWTYCCINCIHVLPDLKYLEEKYADQLVVIGVHAAKFDNEKETENIREAIIRYEIEHPVVNDANMVIARKYFFNSWPTFVLIDPEGNFVGRQPGEGNRELFDKVIGDMVKFHRKKGTLDETPVTFNLEKAKEPERPLQYPGKVLADAKGKRLFISDSNHNRIVVSSLDGQLIDIIGSGKIGATDGSYKEASFDHPQGMALVGETLYVADTENHLLREIDLKSKQVKTLSGTGVQARQRLQRGQLREFALNSPWDLQELNGVLYIAMAGPHQLFKHDLGSNTIELFAGNGREDIVDGPLDSSSLAQPSAIVTDGKALYFVDSEGSAVREVRDGQVTTLVGAHDLARGRSLFEFGDIDGTGDEVRLQHPIGLAIHNGNLYVADTYNDKIKQVNIKSRKATSWLGTGEEGAGLDPVQLSEPAGVTATDQFLFIADTNNHRILKTNLETKTTAVLTVEGLAPPKSSGAEDAAVLADGDAKAVDRQRLVSGASNNVLIKFALPEGYKLNKLAPVVYQLNQLGNETVLATDQLGKRQRAKADELSAMIDLPLAATSGQGSFELAVSYQYCRDGVGGVCRFATEKWEIPVEIAASGEATTIVLETSAE